VVRSLHVATCRVRYRTKLTAQQLDWLAEHGLDWR
jgi:hypothetical protein